LDEFFCKRIGALKRQEAAGVENLINVQPKMAWTPQQQLKYVARLEYHLSLLLSSCAFAWLDDWNEDYVMYSGINFY